MIGNVECSEVNDGRGLVDRCIDAAARVESIEKWRRQRRTLERLPAQLADALFHRLHRRGLLYPTLLEVFQHCVEEIDLHGENHVDAEWMAYLGAFRCLRILNLESCRGISNSSLWSIAGMATLRVLDLSRCSRITDAGLEHILSLKNLEKLHLSETKLTSAGIKRISSLVNLRLLDLGGLPVTDQALLSLEVLTQLEYLDLWGSEITDHGAAMLNMFPKLSYLNLAWTSVKKLPTLPNLARLNISNCSIDSIVEGNCSVKALLSELSAHNTTFSDVDEAFSREKVNCLSALDLSSSPICSFHFLANMTLLENLDLSFSQMADSLVDSIASVGFNLKHLNLSNTKITSQGLCFLAGNVPNLKKLCLSKTFIDDASLQYLSMMPSLREIDLSKTRIKGFLFLEGSMTSSLALLRNLVHLENLNLEETQMRDEALHSLGTLRELKYLYLKSDFLSDVSLHSTLSLPNLIFLGFQGTVLTNQGLHLFRPPTQLRVLDLRGCWLLNSDSVATFCEDFSQIEVKHESVKILPSYQNIQLGSPVHGTNQERKLKAKWKKKEGQSCCRLKNYHFADERMKYSRDELLELQFSPLSALLGNSHAVLPLPQELLKD